MRLAPTLLLLTVLSCGAAETVRRSPQVVRHYGLSEETRDGLSESAETEAELTRVLVEYFGEPDQPRMAVLPEWSTEGFDPNSSPFDGKRPDLGEQGVTQESLAEENSVLWKRELGLIAEGELDRIGPFRSRRKMSTQWRERRADKSGDAGAQAEFFIERYPNLAEAAELFGVFCARCHGFEGGGNGPMGSRLFPKPRNYRAGTFKYVSTLSSVKPRRDDLLRTLIHGLPGTAMPSFRRLGTSELNALVDYVVLLSIRGELESWLVDDWLDGGEEPSETIAEFYAIIWERWRAAEADGLLITAPPADATRARWDLGKDMFLDATRGNCVSCHGTEGKGDGPSAMRIEEDGTEFALLKDEWDEFVLPRNLTEGKFRGGSNREDIYRRMYCGIPGTPMPSIGESQNTDGSPLLSEDEAWALVDYVLSLSGQGPFGAKFSEY
jgi:mono/diheme cytochrome c family protein